MAVVSMKQLLEAGVHNTAKIHIQREIFKNPLQFAPGYGTILRQYTRIALFFCAFFAVTRQKG